MHYALTRLGSILPPRLARLGKEVLSNSPEGPRFRLPSLILNPVCGPLHHPRTTPRCVLTLLLTDTHTNIQGKYTAGLSFSACGLEMGRWAAKVCHQQKRTE